MTFNCFQLVNDVCLIYFTWPSEVVKNAVGIFLIFIQFFIPFVILVILYGQIVWMLSRRINTNMTDTKDNKDNKTNTKDDSIEDKGTDSSKQLADAQRDRFQLARRNTIKTLLIVGCCFIIC